MRSSSLIVGVTVLMFAAGVCHPVTSPILRSTVSHFSHGAHFAPGFQSFQFAPAGIWNVRS